MAASVSSPPPRPSRANTAYLGDYEYFPVSSSSFLMPDNRQTHRMSPPSFNDRPLIPLESHSSLNTARPGIAKNGGNGLKKSTFGFRSKRVEITTPYDFVHLAHVSESSTGELIGLPKDWHQLLQENGIHYSGREMNPRAVIEIVKFHQEGKDENVGKKMSSADNYPHRPAAPPPTEASISRKKNPVSFDVRTPEELAAVNRFLLRLGRDVDGTNPKRSLQQQQPLTHLNYNPSSYFAAASVPPSYRPAPTPQPASNAIDRSMSQSQAQFQSTRPAPARPQTASNAIDHSISQRPNKVPEPKKQITSTTSTVRRQENKPRTTQKRPVMAQPSVQQQPRQQREQQAKPSIDASSKSQSLIAPARVDPQERSRERQREQEYDPLQEKRGAQLLSQSDVQQQQTEQNPLLSSLHSPLKNPVALAGERERERDREMQREMERDPLPEKHGAQILSQSDVQQQQQTEPSPRSSSPKLPLKIPVAVAGEVEWDGDLEKEGEQEPDQKERERDHQNQQANRGDRQSEPSTAETAQSSTPATAAFDMNAIQRIAMTVLDDREAKKKFLAMSQSDPIPVANLFQTLLNQDNLPTQSRSQLARTLARLAKSSRCYPDCLILTSVRRTGTDPVAGGGFADVWKGYFAEEPVALKALRIYKHSIREKALKEFSHEAVIWRQLKHPNILPFYGVFTGDEHFDRLCLVSPWMDAGNAIDYLNVHPDGNRLSLLSDVSQGLKYLHVFQPPIIHGDLKGANIFVSPTFTACLGDFGLARFRDSQESTLATTTGNTTGTLRWQAPELLNIVEGESTRRSEQCDIYSFGCVCLELMTGKPPFSEIRMDGAVIMAIAKGQIPQRPLENVFERGLDDALWALMQQCWNFDPALRPKIVQVAEYFQRHHFARLGGVHDAPQGVRVSLAQHGFPDRFVSDVSNLLPRVEGDESFV